MAGQLRGLRSISEIDVLWITAGLGCDGESVALTAATQPSIEELILGGLPGLPKVNFHNPFYSYGGIHAMRGNPSGRDACIIGEVKAAPQGIVAMVTGFGGTRIVDMLVGEQLPRIC